MAGRRKSLDDRLRDVYLREEKVEKAAELLSRRAKALQDRAEKLATQANEVMRRSEEEIDKRAAAAVEKAEAAAAPRFSPEHHAVADRIARGFPAQEGGRAPTAREVTAALQLLASLDQKAQERQDRKGGAGRTGYVLVSDPYAQYERECDEECEGEPKHIVCGDQVIVNPFAEMGDDDASR